MKEKINQIGKKKLIAVIVAVVAVIALAVVLILVFSNKEPKTIQNEIDANYVQLVDNKDATASDIDKALSEYEKTEKSDVTVYTKGNETVKVKTDKEGNITYLCYNNQLADDVQVKLDSFNESKLKIGDKMADVLSLLKNDKYIYHLRTTNEEGQALEIYYYGWTSKEAVLELVFTDGKLTYYTINNGDLAVQSDAPDVKDLRKEQS